MKLINKKKLSQDIWLCVKAFNLKGDDLWFMELNDALQRVLSKHTHDLPKKKDPRIDVTRLSHKDAYDSGKAWGYNLCLEDCEKK